MNRGSRRPLEAALCVLFCAGANFHFAPAARAQLHFNDCSDPGCGCPADASQAGGLRTCAIDCPGPDGSVRSGIRLCCPNLAVAAVLSRLDIDGDGVADNAPDSDGDGLPDNWESGGAEALNVRGEQVDRVVFFPAPSAIVPGTPPTPIFTRLSVATDACTPDTDDDGLSDYVEVFGLKFVDENRDGRLNAFEWFDFSGDGLPSPGEFPRANTGEEIDTGPPDPVTNAIPTFIFLHDFDGFVFTDPTNRDTDGDGFSDAEDNDPLINPRSFGVDDVIIVRFNALGDGDIDKDGLGNGMDMGNDIVSTDAAGAQDFQIIDNPQNITELLDLFRPDLLNEGVIPESQIEDLLGADWNSDGLWRTTDVRTWHLIVDDATVAATAASTFFYLDPDNTTTRLFAPQSFDDIQTALNAADFDPYGGGGARQRGDGIGMGWQDLLVPPENVRTVFVPDPRVWAILYSWRVPGFDIDGDGFVGVPNVSSTFGPTAGVQSIGLQANPSPPPLFVAVADTALVEANGDRPFDDRISFEGAVAEDGNPKLDGQIEAPFTLPCGRTSATIFGFVVLGLTTLRFWRRR